MAFNLREVLGLIGPPAQQTSKASYYTPLPKVGPQAFLHTIFQAESPNCLEEADDECKLPGQWRSFLQEQNGANLFLNSLYLYGIVRSDRMINRSALRVEKPFALELPHDGPYSRDWLKVGSYGFNASLLFLNRNSGRLLAVSRYDQAVLAEWADASCFLLEEMTRLRSLFSEAGELLVDERHTVPRQQSRS